MKTVAIIPARGGSKGIPRKNVREVGGRPMIAHTISAAKEAEGVDAVYVSTDDQEIRIVSEEYGAEVIERPSELASDTASSESAILHALEVLGGDGVVPEFVVFLQCTSPLTSASDIDGLLSEMKRTQADSALSVTSSHAFIWKYDEGAGAFGVNHDKAIRKRRQELEPEYAENGAVYCFKTKDFVEYKHRFFGKTAIYQMPRETAVEIDDESDFAIVEQLFRKRGTSKTFDLNGVRAVVFDFDGVFTDNKVHLDEKGVESVTCDRGDGMGIGLLKKHTDLAMAVISTERNPVVSARAKKLKIDCLQGVDDKVSALSRWAKEQGINIENIAFMGNDINDLPVLKVVGFPVIVSDAHESLDDLDAFRVPRKGGRGAVRYFCDSLLRAQNKSFAPWHA
ncbi:MAG: cytidylyltransferase domain-containing protein [Opitutales bacterium]